MKYTIYEHPITHKYALVRLSRRVEEGGKPSIVPTVQWFHSRAEAVAGLAGLFNREELESHAEMDEPS